MLDPALDIRHWDPLSDPIIAFGMVFDARSFGHYVVDIVEQQHNEQSSILKAAHELENCLWTLHKLLKKAKQAQSETRDSITWCRLSDIIGRGSELVEMIQDMYTPCEQITSLTEDCQKYRSTVMETFLGLDHGDSRTEITTFIQMVDEWEDDLRASID